MNQETLGTGRKAATYVPVDRSLEEMYDEDAENAKYEVLLILGLMLLRLKSVRNARTVS